MLSHTNMYTEKKNRKSLALAVGRWIWKRMTLLSRREVLNAPSHDGCAPRTSQRVSTRLPQVSLHEKAPRLPGFSMEEERTPAPASKPKFEGALKGWKWCHNMKRMLLPWNFAIEIHVVNFCLYFFGQRDNCTWMLVQETHQIMGAPRQNCHLTQVDFKSYSRPPGTPGQSSRLISCGWSYPNPTRSSIYQPQLHGSQKCEKFFPAFWEISKKIEEIVSNLVLTN